MEMDNTDYDDENETDGDDNNDGHDDHLIRFCFAKTDELLLKAADKINMIPSLS